MPRYVLTHILTLHSMTQMNIARQPTGRSLSHATNHILLVERNVHLEMPVLATSTIGRRTHHCIDHRTDMSGNDQM